MGTERPRFTFQIQDKFYSLLWTPSLPLEVCVLLNLIRGRSPYLYLLFALTFLQALSYNMLNKHTLNDSTFNDCYTNEESSDFYHFWHLAWHKVVPHKFRTNSLGCEATTGKATRRASNEKPNQTEEVCQPPWCWQEGARCREVNTVEHGRKRGGRTPCK